MRSWPALLLAPLVALAQQSICLSLLRQACQQQTTLALHLVCGGSLALIVAMTALAASGWRAARLEAAREAGATAANETARVRRPGFVAIAGMLVGALCTLVALSMWMPVWVLDPCLS